MRPRRWQGLASGAALILAGLGAGEARAQAAADTQVQTPEELGQRVLELEQSTREQVESLKRKIQELEAARVEEKRLQEDQEEQFTRKKEQRTWEEQTARRGGRKEFFDLEAGAQQGAASELAPWAAWSRGDLVRIDLPQTGDAPPARAPVA